MENSKECVYVIWWR